MEVLSCPEEMEWDHRGGVVQEQEEAVVEGEEVLVGERATVLEPDPAVVAFAPTVGQKSLIKQELPAII